MDRSTNPAAPPIAAPTMIAFGVRDLGGGGAETVVEEFEVYGYETTALLMIVVGDPDTIVTIVLMT